MAFKTPVLDFNPQEFVSGQYLKAGDIDEQGGEVVVTIESARQQTFDFDKGPERKIILGLLETDQEFRLNKTQVSSMIKLFTKDPNKWLTRRMKLTTAPTPVGDTILIKPAKKTVMEEHDDDASAVAFDD